jgi:histidine triad (HIT) family protein
MSLDGVYDPDNIFAKITRRELPSAIIFEDDDVLAFMDAFPQSKGHCLVISKTSRARNLLEADAGTLTQVINAVQKVTRAVREALEPDGIIVTQFNGAPAGQTIFHLHFHIIPRWSDRPMAGHGAAAMADSSQLQDLAQLIGNKLS